MRNAMSWIAMSNEMIGIRAEYRGTELRTVMSWIAMSRVQRCTELRTDTQ
jgi:hypothetical protein